MQIAATGYSNIFNSKTPTPVRSQSRAYPQGASTEGAATQADSSIAQKLADFSRVKSAFLAAMQTGQSISKHFEPIV
jgi:hypothetical protein